MEILNWDPFFPGISSLYQVDKNEPEQKRPSLHGGIYICSEDVRYQTTRRSESHFEILSVA